MKINKREIRGVIKDVSDMLLFLLLIISMNIINISVAISSLSDANQANQTVQIGQFIIQDTPVLLSVFTHLLDFNIQILLILMGIMIVLSVIKGFILNLSGDSGSKR